MTYDFARGKNIHKGSQPPALTEAQKIASLEWVQKGFRFWRLMKKQQKAAGSEVLQTNQVAHTGDNFSQPA